MQKDRRRGRRAAASILHAAAIATAAVVAAGLAEAARADQWQTVSSAHSSVEIEQPTRLRQLDPVLQQLFLPDVDQDLKLTSTIQLFPVDPELFGIPRARGRARADVQCFGPSGPRDLGSVNRKFDRDGDLVIDMRIPAQDDCEIVTIEWDFLKRFQLPGETSIEIDSAIELVGDNAEPDCFDARSLCLNDDRFQVEVRWRDFQGEAGRGIAFPRSDDSGTFFFFDADNAELLVKVLDGCDFNDHFWVFYAATTDVEFNVTVTDTRRGQTRRFQNPLGRPVPPVLDTRAFATCP